MSFDFGEAHLAKHVLSCYFWQVVSFRRAKCMRLQYAGQVLRPKLLLLLSNKMRKEDKATLETTMGCWWGER